MKIEDKGDLQKSHSDYKIWLVALKNRVRQVQIKAAVSVNKELVQFYWELGADIVEKQANSQWGDGFLLRLSTDLMTEFPDMKGFSNSNLKYIKRWYLFYSQYVIGQQAVALLPLSLLFQIPWGHNIAIISKCKDFNEAVYYFTC